MKRYLASILFCLFTFLLCSIATSQDVAISAINTDTPDGFTLVALVDIPSTQNIFFTDQDWNATTNQFEDNGGASGNEGSVRITWTGTWAKGTMIRVVEDAAPFTISTSTGGPSGADATIVYAGDGFSLGGSEAFSVYSASSTTDPAANVTEVYTNVRMNTSIDNNPNADVDCPCSASFVEINFNNSSVDHFDYTTVDRDGVTLAQFTNPSNYSTSSAPGVMDITPEYTNLMFGGSGLLPVELTSFTANSKEKGTFLNWQTASEENNHYFQIEHSMDGRNFMALDKVNGMGTSVEINNYNYLHSTPQSGLNYYRLKQVDYDDVFEYSKVVSVKNEIGGIPFNVYPNPFENVVTLTFPSSEDTYTRLANRSVKVYNMFGRLLESIEISMDETTSKIDLSQLSIGTYFIEVTIGDKLYSTQRLIKL